MIDRKLNIVMWVFGAVGGLLGYFAGRPLLALGFPRPVLVALYMGVLGLCIVVCCVLAETLFPIINGMTWKRKYAALTWRYLVPAILVPMLLLGGLMQLIYQIDFTSQKGRDVYMLIDRSGSMEWNDPNNDRLSAVNRLVETFNPHDRVEIIIFDHEAEVAQELTYVKDSAVKDQIAAYLSQIAPRGGTDFNTVLSLTHERITQHAQQKNEPVVILLSDGESDMDTDLLTTFLDNGIKINTVGLRLDKKDGEAMLAYIARRTFGQFVMADDTDELDMAFSQIYQPEDRFILNAKTSPGVDGLQWLLFILGGLLIGLVTAFIFDNRYIIVPLTAGGAVGGLLAGALLCWPVGLLLPAVILGSLFTLFTLFAKTPPLALPPADTVTDGGFLQTETPRSKTRRQF